MDATRLSFRGKPGEQSRIKTRNPQNHQKITKIVGNKGCSQDNLQSLLKENGNGNSQKETENPSSHIAWKRETNPGSFPVKTQSKSGARSRGLDAVFGVNSFQCADRKQEYGISDQKKGQNNQENAQNSVREKEGIFLVEKTVEKPGNKKSQRHGNKNIPGCMAAQIHTGEAHKEHQQETESFQKFPAQKEAKGGK